LSLAAQQNTDYLLVRDTQQLSVFVLFVVIMIISAVEAVNSESSTDGNKSNSEAEAMPAILSSKNLSTMSNSKRTACSASEADCYNMSLGAGPLWWS